jgi:hypothetical protein
MHEISRMASPGFLFKIVFQKIASDKLLDEDEWKCFDIGKLNERAENDVDEDLQNFPSLFVSWVTLLEYWNRNTLVFNLQPTLDPSGFLLQQRLFLNAK